MSATGAMKRRAASKNLQGFGKQWKSGDTVRVYYPLGIDPETGEVIIIVSGAYGHSIDCKEIAISRIFIPTNSTLDDTGRPTVSDTMHQFSKISKLFIEGQRKEEENKITSNTKMTASAAKTAMEKIAAKYKDMSAAVSKLKMVISTECVVVPMVGDVPDDTKAVLVTQDLSDEKIVSLNKIIKDKQYGITADSKYLEVTYSYGTSGDKKLDGKVAPSGITPAYSLKETNPDKWEIISQRIETLPTDSDIINKRNSNYRPVSETSIIKALSDYSTRHYSELDVLADDAEIKERVEKMAGFINTLGIPLEKYDLSVQEDEKDISANGADDAVNFANIIDSSEIEAARLVADSETPTDEADDFGAVALD